MHKQKHGKKPKKMTRQHKVFTIVSLLFLAGIVFLWGWPGHKESLPVAEAQKPKVTVFKPMGCGCCGHYVTYLQEQGFRVETVELYTVNALRQKYGVPEPMKSCHTAIVGKYFVEGHVPVAALEKLLADTPPIKGIALPGMPSGSPGMSGPKSDTFRIYAIGGNGTTSEFMTQ